MSCALVKFVTGSLGNFSLLPLNEDDRGLPRDLITDSMKSKSRVAANTFKIFFFFLVLQPVQNA